MGMLYSKGYKMISIEKQPLLGKVKPELYVGEGNQMLKVACFGSVEKAEKFEEWLRYFFGDQLVKDDIFAVKSISECNNN